MLNAYLDGRFVGARGGADPFGSNILTVGIGTVPGSTQDATAIDAGRHELSVEVTQHPIFERLAQYTTPESSFIITLDRESTQLLSLCTLSVQFLTTSNIGTFRWTFSLDDGGTIQQGGASAGCRSS